MTLTPAWARFTLTTHVAVSVGWAGALAAFLAHAVVSVSSTDIEAVRAVSIAMALIAWFVILPLSLATLTTGLVQALGTSWGLVRHYWVVFKLVLTAVATAILLLKLGPISQAAAADTPGLRVSILVHAAGGLAVLLAALALAIYKPAGRVGAAPPPRWVKVFGLIVALLAAMLAAMLAGGGHGPSSHF